MKKKILLADDDEGTLALVEAIVQNDGTTEIYTARDGEETLNLARQVKPNVIFLDVQMPKKNGFEICKELKEDPATADMVVVMLTGLTSESAREKAMEDSDADDYITKPFSPTELFNKFEEILRHQVKT